jgi:hypothetical protein
MTTNKALLRVEGMEDRWTPAHLANLGEGVSVLATSVPGAQATLVHTTQVAAGTIDRIIDRLDRTVDRLVQLDRIVPIDRIIDRLDRVIDRLDPSTD